MNNKEIADLRQWVDNALPTLSATQARHKVWESQQFGCRPRGESFLGIIEEMGEYCHAMLKSSQGIRTKEDHNAGKLDALHDLTIFTLSYLTKLRIDVRELPIVEYIPDTSSPSLKIGMDTTMLYVCYIVRDLGKLATIHMHLDADPNKDLSDMNRYRISNTIARYLLNVFALHRTLTGKDNFLVEFVATADKVFSRDWVNHKEQGVDRG